MRRILALSTSISAISAARRSSSHSSSSASSAAIVSGRGRRSAIRARHGKPHGAPDRDVRGRAGHRVAGAANGLVLGLGEPPLGEVGQLEIVEEHVEEFLASGRSGTRPRPPLAGLPRPAAALARAGILIAFDEFLVAGQHLIAEAAAASMERRLAQPVERNADLRPSMTSRMSRLCEDCFTALHQRLARRRKRCRFSGLLLPGSDADRRCAWPFSRAGSAGLLHPHVPFDQAADLPLGIAAGHHAPDELSMFFSLSPSFFEPKEITGSRSSTWENIRFSITSRIFS